MDVLDAVEAAYEARWGTPEATAEFRTAEGLRIEVHKWSAKANRLGVVLYATVGASAEPMPEGERTHRVEFLLGLRPARDDVASALAALGLFSAREHEAVDHGHTVPADGPLWPETAMSAFLVLRQVGEIIPTLQLPDGLHVEFLQAVPIFESERRFKINHGVDALLQRWESAMTPFWDPRRLPEPVGE